MAWQQTANLETGDLTEFDSTSGVTAAAAAAKNGSYGLSFAITNTATRYGRFGNPVGETIGSFETWFNPNGITMATGDAFYITLPYDSGGNWFANVVLNKSAGSLQLIGEVYPDLGGTTSTSAVNITDAWHKVGVSCQAATSAGANDGWLKLYIDGVLSASLTGADTDTRTYDNVYFCTYGPDAGTSGTVYMDDCRWSDIEESGLAYTSFTPRSTFFFSLAGLAIPAATLVGLYKAGAVAL